MSSRVDMRFGWRLYRQGCDYGPYSWAELVGLARAGNVASSDLVWHPSLADWVPALEVQGLCAAPGGPGALLGAQPVAAGGGFGRRSSPAGASRPQRPGLIVAIVALVIVLAAGGTAAAILLTRDGSGPPGIVDSRLTGTVTLPPGVALEAASLRVLSNTSTSAVSVDSRFDVAGIGSEGAPRLAIAVNAQGNPVLLGMSGLSLRGADTGLSARSTALALVLFDLAVLTLPPDGLRSVIALAEAHSRVGELEAAVVGAMVADPDDPLDADGHPELYELAAAITFELLEQVAPVEEAEVAAAADTASTAAPYLVASAGRMVAGKPAVAAATSPAADVFVTVEDDPEHKAPEVVLVNTTFAHYRVTWSRTFKGKTTSDSVFLARCTPVSALRWDWPPVGGFRRTRALDIGDGKLSFRFERLEGETKADFVVTCIGAFAGVAAEGLRKPAILEELSLMFGSGGALFQMGKDMGILADKMPGMSWTQAARATGELVALNSVRMFLALSPYIARTISEDYVRVLGKTLIKKSAAAAIVAGYGAFDIVSMLLSTSNQEQATHQVVGSQVNGLFPAEVGEFGWLNPSPAGYKELESMREDEPDPPGFGAWAYQAQVFERLATVQVMMSDPYLMNPLMPPMNQGDGSATDSTDAPAPVPADAPVRFTAEVSVFQPDVGTLAKWGGDFFDIFPPELFLQTAVSPDDENFAPFYSSLNAYVDDNAKYSYTTSTGAEVENAFLLGRIADRLVVVTVRYTVNPLDDNGVPVWKSPEGLAIESDSLNAALAPMDERKRDDLIAIWQYCREKWTQR